jgi:hypothetical protein
MSTETSKKAVGIEQWRALRLPLGLALQLAIALSGCSSSPPPETSGIDSRGATDAGAEMPSPPPGSDADSTDAAPVDGSMAPLPPTDAAAAETSNADTAGPTDAPTSDAAAGPNDAGSPSSIAYTCTMMIGIQATEEWYDHGFESMVDNSKWELVWVHSGFVELWANPSDPVWSTQITSPCAQNANKPDRVIFLALNFDYDTPAQWNPVVAGAVANIKARYPTAKRIELRSFIRAPGNLACPQAPAPRSTITPAEDEALALTAAADPTRVFVAPKFEAKTCGEYSSNPPHPSPAGVTAWVKMMADYYR